VTVQGRGSQELGPTAARPADDLLRAFVHASDTLLCIVDGDGRILLTNPALQRFTGRDEDELEGQPFWDVYVAPEHVLLAQDAVARAMATGVAHPQEGDWLTWDGERRRVSMRNTVLRDDEPDWVNTIFLSTRFKAWRVGGYNEYLYTFFKCLTDERIAYADGWFAEAHDDTASITMDGWEMQRRCPHLKADLSKFGVVEGNTLTCNLHGWQWNLTNGRCLTSKGHELRSRRA